MYSDPLARAIAAARLVPTTSSKSPRGALRDITAEHKRKFKEFAERGRSVPKEPEFTPKPKVKAEPTPPPRPPEPELSEYAQRVAAYLPRDPARSQREAVDLAERAIATFPEWLERQLTAREMIVIVATAHNLTVKYMLEGGRRAMLVQGRQQAAYELYRTGRFTLPQIGRWLGGLDHTTVLHAIRQHAARWGRPVIVGLETQIRYATGARRAAERSRGSACSAPPPE